MELEATITINGIKLTNAEAMTVRVAINSFLIGLRDGHLGDDDVGKSLTTGYTTNGSTVLRLMSRR